MQLLFVSRRFIGKPPPGNTAGTAKKYYEQSVLMKPWLPCQSMITEFIFADTSFASSTTYLASL